MSVISVKVGERHPYDGCMREDDSSKTVRKIVAHNVRTLRREEHLSQQALSDMICMNRTFLSDIERCQGNPSLDIVVKIADGLNVPITRLFEGAESCPPYQL